MTQTPKRKTYTVARGQTRTTAGILSAFTLQPVERHASTLAGNPTYTECNPASAGEAIDHTRTPLRWGSSFWIPR